MTQRCTNWPNQSGSTGCCSRSWCGASSGVTSWWSGSGGSARRSSPDWPAYRPACGIISDEQALEVALVENLQREDINPLEAARAYKRLAEEFGLTQEQIATKVGKSRSTVANTMRLLQLSPAEQRSLEKGEITEGHARALLASEPGRRKAMLDEITSGKTSVREAEEMARAGRTTETVVEERTGSSKGFRCQRRGG